MLVLSRKYDEKIMIGKDIVITVLKINGENVSLGIQAPRSMSIYREEVFLEIEKENKQGAIQPENVDIESIAKSLNLAKNSDSWFFFCDELCMGGKALAVML